MSETSEVLRRAARLMRERAEAAIPGPWTENVLGSEGYAVMAPPIDPAGKGHQRMRRWVARVGMNDWQVDKDTAVHIASWHPAVALAVADWLDERANLHDFAIEAGGRGLSPNDPEFAVARAYLGADQ